MKRFFFWYVLTVFFSCMSLNAFSDKTPVVSRNDGNKQKQKDYIILIHGLGRTSRSMFTAAAFFKKRNYKVVTFGYASTKYDIEDIAAQLDKVIKKKCKGKDNKIHFVTHSLGGIVTRYYLKNNKLKRLGRVVMLAPPHKGSQLADWLKDNMPFYRWIFGPSGQQLGTDKESVPLMLGEVDFELGVIAGDKSFNPFFSKIIPGPDDGKVSVESTRVKGMKDFIIIHSNHTSIMKDEDVLEQTDCFLQNGFFNPHISSK